MEDNNDFNNNQNNEPVDNNTNNYQYNPNQYFVNNVNNIDSSINNPINNNVINNDSSVNNPINNNVINNQNPMNNENSANNENSNEVNNSNLNINSSEDYAKFEKRCKDATGVAYVVLIMDILLAVLFMMTGHLTVAVIIGRILILALTITAIMGFKKKKKYGPICGIIISILFILCMSLFDIIIGVLYLIDNIKIIKYFKD